MKKVLHLAAAQAGQDTDAQDAVIAAAGLGGAIDGEIQFADGALRPAHKVFTGRRQPYALRTALKDRSTEPVFQLLDSPRHRRLLDAQVTPGATEPAVLGRGQDVTQVVKAKARPSARLAQVGDSKIRRDRQHGQPGRRGPVGRTPANRATPRRATL
ncbi:hypothetical protein LJR300_003496 [Caulobacter sp. LjRoot300]